MGLRVCKFPALSAVKQIGAFVETLTAVNMMRAAGLYPTGMTAIVSPVEMGPVMAKEPATWQEPSIDR